MQQRLHIVVVLVMKHIIIIMNAQRLLDQRRRCTRPSAHMNPNTLQGGCTHLTGEIFVLRDYKMSVILFGQD